MAARNCRRCGMYMNDPGDNAICSGCAASDRKELNDLAEKLFVESYSQLVGHSGATQPADSIVRGLVDGAYTAALIFIIVRDSRRS